MFRSDRHDGGTTPSMIGPAGAPLLRLGAALLRVLGLVAAVLLFVGLNPDPDPAAAHGGPESELSVAVAAAPTNHPCGPSDSSHHDHALCGLATTCPLFVQADTEIVHLVADRAMPVVGADLDFTSCDPLAPFHPPKLPLVA